MPRLTKLKNFKEIIKLNELSLRQFFIPTTYAPGMTHPAASPLIKYLSVRNAITDDDAIQGLNNLVMGPIRSWETLEKAEMALRALILHDRADCIFPSVLVTYDFADSTQPVYEQPKWPYGIEAVLMHANMSHRFVFIEWIKISDKKLFKEISQWSHHKNNYIGDEYLGHLHETPPEIIRQFVASKRLKEALISTPAILGAASYFANKDNRIFENKKIRLVNPQAWFKEIDNGWQGKLNELSASGLNIRLGPLLSIILSRASSRDKIPQAIIEFREEMEKPRTQLWGILEELQFEKSHHKMLQRADKIIKAAESVIPYAYPSNLNIIRFGWNAIKNLRLLPTIMSLGNEFVERGLLRRQVHTIDAARLLSRSFRQAKGLPQLLETFLTREEFRNLWCQ